MLVYVGPKWSTLGSSRIFGKTRLFQRNEETNKQLLYIKGERAYLYALYSWGKDGEQSEPVDMYD